MPGGFGGVDVTRDDLLRHREQLLVRELRKLREEFTLKSYPLAEELSNLRASRDRPVITAKDGTTYQYTGPMPPYRLPGEV